MKNLLFCILLGTFSCVPATKVGDKFEVSLSEEGGASVTMTGAQLYTINCASCHGALESSLKKDSSSDSILQAIVNVPGMSHLDMLTGEHINAIALALKSEAPVSTSTAPAPTPSPAPAPAPAPTTQVSVDYESFFRHPFHKNSAWNIRPENPVLGSQGLQSNTYKPQISNDKWSVKVFRAEKTDPPQTIYALDPAKGIADPDSGYNRKSIVIPHWPKGVYGAVEADGHADVIDMANGIVHSFWRLKKDATTGQYKADMWAWTKLDGRGFADPSHTYQGARASGLATMGGLIRIHEVNDGKDMYHHALAMSLPAESLSKSYIYPATSTDSNAEYVHIGNIPDGALMMLPASFPVESLNKESMRKIARTLKTYGARVVDRNTGTPYAIYAEIGTPALGDYSDLVAIRKALKVVTGQSSWINKIGENVPNSFFENEKKGFGVDLFSLRLINKVVRGEASEVGTFDSLSKSVKWGKTGATAVVQTSNWSSGINYNRINWGRLVDGATYKVIGESTNGAKCTIKIGNQSVVVDKDNKEGTFVFESGNYITPYLTSGINQNSSSIKCTIRRVQ